MTPPCHPFHASELPARVQEDVHGKRRKVDQDQDRIKLAACELFGMLQYNCEVETPVTQQSAIRCLAVERLFRRCRDKKGTFTVETTAFEGEGCQQEGRTRGSHVNETSKPDQWPSWHHAQAPSSSSSR